MCVRALISSARLARDLRSNRIYIYASWNSRIAVRTVLGFHFYKYLFRVFCFTENVNVFDFFFPEVGDNIILVVDCCCKSNVFPRVRVTRKWGKVFLHGNVDLVKNVSKM